MYLRILTSLKVAMNLKSKIFTLLTLATSSVSLSPKLLSQESSSQESSRSDIKVNTSYSWSAGAEYFKFTRNSDFLGIGASSSATSKLDGSLAGGFIRYAYSPSSPDQFEFIFRSGNLNSSPKYSFPSSYFVISKIVDKRNEYEVGGIHSFSPLISLRYGFVRNEESMTNTLPSNSLISWANGTGGLSPANAQQYIRAMNYNAGYIGLRLKKYSSLGDDKSTTYGALLDTDIQAGQLTSNFLSIRANSVNSATFALPHKATVFMSKSNADNNIIFSIEVGYRGVYNFSSSGGLKGYDYGLFGRASIKIQSF